MNGFEIAAVAMVVGMLPAAAVAVRGRLGAAVVAFEAIATVMVLVFALLAQGFDRSGEFEFPVIVAVLSLGGSLVFARYLEGS